MLPTNRYKKEDYSVENYEEALAELLITKHDLSMYNSFIIEETFLMDYKNIIKDRLKLFQIVENIYKTIQGKTLEQCRFELSIELKNNNLDYYNTIINGPPIPPKNKDSVDARLKDNASHVLIKLVTSNLKAQKRWFVKQEKRLFKLRVFLLDTGSLKLFVALNGLKYKAISDEAKDKMRNALIKYVEDVDTTNFYEANKRCYLYLVKQRKIYACHNKVYLPESLLGWMILHDFTKNLNKTLQKAKQLRLKLQSDSRWQHLFLFVTREMNSQVQIESKAINSNVPIEELDMLSKICYPLCMKDFHNHLRKHHHLRNNGRYLYALFLKNIQIPLNEAEVFWEAEFLKHVNESTDTINRYIYWLRHVFGEVGRKADYQPFKCEKVIFFGSGNDCCSCPYKSLPSDALQEKLRESDIRDIEDIVNKSNRGDYKGACKAYLDDLHGCTYDMAVTHPHEYFLTAFAGYKDMLNPDEKLHISPAVQRVLDNEKVLKMSRKSMEIVISNENVQSDLSIDDSFDDSDV
ncbi:DNA primase large subunit-like [Prorops nasuta]|uniref:DNA primase large subunit-like n=1 Tax=Prorops nasuta TaxID=863751 RepID=UPI0034CEF0D0